MRKIASVGILVADVVAKPVSRYPERGVCVHVQQMELHVGGCAANTGLALAKLGLPVSVVGKVGQDAFGDFLLHTLRQHGADTRGVQRTRTAGTSSTMVMVHPDGERSFIHYMGANAEFCPDDIDWTLISDCALFHLAGAYLMPCMDGEPAARVLQEAKRRGMITCLDTTWDASGQWMRLLQPCLPYLDYITPNYGEAQQLTGETDPERIADRLLAEGVGTAVIKMDAQGCFVKNAETAFHLPACEVEVVDMLGAGDCFTAGWLAGIAMGWDLRRTARLANAVGALCVSALGATTGVKPLAETLAFMEQRCPC
ncbi:MAG: carbohydrate kinase family protein [Fimbriimonadales bacterium]|nr:carbohydrate kinase family protein [Fimbriimonadales bacterium]MCS7191096.1 carbohydrate kinase family protein [Fimbriimonadales bacterium]